MTTSFYDSQEDGLVALQNTPFTKKRRLRLKLSRTLDYAQEPATLRKARSLSAEVSSGVKVAKYSDSPSPASGLFDDYVPMQPATPMTPMLIATSPADFPEYQVPAIPRSTEEDAGRRLQILIEREDRSRDMLALPRYRSLIQVGSGTGLQKGSPLAQANSLSANDSEDEAEIYGQLFLEDNVDYGTQAGDTVRTEAIDWILKVSQIWYLVGCSHC